MQKRDKLRERFAILSTGGRHLRELDHMVVEATTNPYLLNQLISQNEFFIIKCASTVTNRYITKSDDEWSIALLAFHEAVSNYQLEKGNFYSFAELVIKRRLIDYVRSSKKHHNEISVDPTVFDTEPEEDATDMAVHLAVAEKVSKTTGNSIKYEIEAVNEILSKYGFTFFDLTDCSPHAKKTKSACAKAVSFLFQNSMLINEMKSTKLLPLKIIEKNAKIPRKILERHRKYIIAAVEILSGDYPELAEYLWYIREEIGK
jgi:RNA polymerase sigma factor